MAFAAMNLRKLCLTARNHVVAKSACPGLLRALLMRACLSCSVETPSSKLKVPLVDNQVSLDPSYP
jgi:hypothetical protein